MAPKKKFTGQIFFQYLLFYGTGRFWIEGLRTDSLYLWGTNIAVSQALSGILAVLGAGIIIYNLCKVKKNGPDAVLKAELEALAAKNGAVTADGETVVQEAPESTEPHAESTGSDDEDSIVEDQKN